MSDQLPKPETVAARVIALHGGREAFVAHSEEQIAELNARWNQDSALMGMILRSHLFVEYYLSRYLQARNPKLGDLDKARVGFGQKLALMDKDDASVAYLLPGLRHLNVVRNRLAHTLSANVTDDDRNVFLSVDLFRALRDALAAPALPSPVPIDVLEAFSQHAGMSLKAASDETAGYWTKALSDERGDGF